MVGLQMWLEKTADALIVVTIGHRPGYDRVKRVVEREDARSYTHTCNLSAYFSLPSSKGRA